MGAAGAIANGDSAPFVLGGTIVTFTGAQFKAAHAAVIAHVQACFAKQAQLLTEHSAGSITTVEQVELAAWPPNA
jgi:hypothetical protein